MSFSRTSALWILSAVVIIIFAANLSLSFRQGTLAVPPVYDDVVYLLDAAQRVHAGQTDSLFSVVQSFLNKPPHAPFSAATAIAGYRLFGFQVWAPYVANVWGLAVFAIIAYVVARHQSANRFQAIVIASFLMAAPVVQLIVSEFRPDIASGVIFAGALYLIIQTDFSRVGWRSAGFVAGASAAALMSKPSAFVVVLPILGLATIISIACLGQRWDKGIQGVLKTLLLALFVLVPYATIWGPQTYWYIYQVFVTNRDIWSTPGTLVDHMLYHSVGNGGKGALGALLYIGLAAIVIDLVKAVERGIDARVAAYYFVVALLYIGMGLSAEKTLFQGSFFYLPFLIASAIALARIARVLHWQYAPGAALVSAALLFIPIGYTVRSPEKRPELQQMVDQISLQVVAALTKCPVDNPVFLAMAQSPITPETIALSLLLNDNIAIEPTIGYFKRDVQSLVSSANIADFVLFPNERGLRENLIFPGTAFIETVHNDLSAQNNWQTFKPNVNDAPELWSKTCLN